MQVEDCLRQNVGCRVAQHTPALIGGVRYDLERTTGRKGTSDIHELAVEANGNGSLGEPRPYVGGNVGTGGAVVVLADAAIWECQLKGHSLSPTPPGLGSRTAL